MQGDVVAGLGRGSPRADPSVGGAQSMARRRLGRALALGPWLALGESARLLLGGARRLAHGRPLGREAVPG